MKKHLLILTLKYGFGFGLLAWVIWGKWHVEGPGGQELGISGVVQRVLQGTISWGPFALAMAICTVSILITFVRWFVLVRAQNLPFTLASAIRLGLIGFYLSICMPGSVGGDIIKAAFLAREQSRRTVAVATVLMDRVLGLCGLFWLVALIGSIFWLTGSLDTMVHSEAGRILLQIILYVALGVLASTLVFWFVLCLLSNERAQRLAAWLERIPKVGPSLAELWRALWMYRQQGKAVITALGLSMVGHLGFVLTFYFCSLTLNAPQDIPTLSAHYLVVPVGMTFQGFFPTPGGVGGAEWGYGWLYAQTGPDLIGNQAAATEISPQGFAACIMQRILTWALGFLGYLVYLRMKPSLTGEEKTEKDLVLSSVSSSGQEA